MTRFNLRTGTNMLGTNFGEFLSTEGAGELAAIPSGAFLHKIFPLIRKFMSLLSRMQQLFVWFS